MRNRKMLVTMCVLSAFLLFGLTASASANSRTAVSVKSGSGTGLFGLEIEHRFENGFAICLEGGGLYVPMGDAKAWFFEGAVSGRYYFVRGDINPFVSLGALAVGGGVEAEEVEGKAVMPGIIGVAGAEVMFNRIRLAAELGYEVVFSGPPDNEKLAGLVYGVSLGYTF
ncbi:MAG: hypothetical protein PHP20_00065 [Firmicutes bacterium]|jgi:hypothetical protein|nr:hypothetical protein [Bacillota bacterium]MDD4336897.1 hypothetical protein [Bacillota bacterium]MDD4791452.1 hypothetical protein [Bacillota bacterium]